MKSKLCLLIIAFFVLANGCTEHLTVQPTSQVTEAISPTYSPPPTLVETISSDLIVTPEVTPLPSLAPDSIKASLARFVRSNGGCKIPCLMGLTPDGSYKSVESFSSYFTKNTQQSNDQINSVEIVGYLDDKGGGTLLVFWDNRIRVQIGIGAYLAPDKKQIDHVTLSASVYEHLEDDIGVEFARLLQEHPSYDNLLKSFSLPTILTEYGEPAAIWVYPFPEDPGYSYKSSAYRFVFILIYIDLGFAIEYVSTVRDDGEYLTGCPDVDNIKISAWNPQTKQAITLNDVSQYFSGTDGISPSNVSFFKPLQDVTSLSINDFYETYKKNNSNEACIQTPRQLWP